MGIRDVTIHTFSINLFSRPDWVNYLIIIILYRSRLNILLHEELFYGYTYMHAYIKRDTLIFHSTEIQNKQTAAIMVQKKQRQSGIG